MDWFDFIAVTALILVTLFLCRASYLKGFEAGTRWHVHRRSPR